MWETAILPHFDCDSSFYRIKPESTYRPFKDAEECWTEMLKHQPFGWVKDTEANEYLNVYCISNSASSIDLFGRMFKRCIFIDGSPYGKSGGIVMASWVAVDKSGTECIYADKKPLRGKDKWGPD